MVEELTLKDVNRRIEELSTSANIHDAELIAIDAQIEEAQCIIDHPENVSDIEELTNAQKRLEELKLKKIFITSRKVKFETPEGCQAVYLAMLKAQAENNAKFRSDMSDLLPTISKIQEEVETREKSIFAMYDKYRQLFDNTQDFPKLLTVNENMPEYSALKSYLMRINQLNSIKRN